MDRNALLDALCGMNEPQFDELLFRLGVNISVLPPQTAALSQRAIAVQDDARRPHSFAADPASAFVAALAEDWTQDRLSEIRALARQGRPHAAMLKLDEIEASRLRTAPVSDATRAAVLRLRAALALEAESVELEEIRGWVRQATSLHDDLSQDRTLDALIARRDGGAATALQSLKGAPRTTPIQNLRAALLLETDAVVDALNVLDDTPEPDHDTFRLHALAALIQNDLAEARRAIDQAVARSLDSRPEHVRFTAALIDVREALAPGARLEHLFWPSRVMLDLLLRSSHARERLRSAADGMSALASETDGPDRPLYELWHLACRCLLGRLEPSERQAATTLAATLLEEDPGAPQIVAWVIDAALDVDLDKARRRLESRCSTDRPTASEVDALLALYRHHQRIDDALTLLDHLEANPPDDANPKGWVAARARLLVAANRPREAMELLDSRPEDADLLYPRAMALEAIAQTTGAWDDVFTFLDRAWSTTHDPYLLWRWMILKEKQQDWQAVLDRADTLFAVVLLPQAIRSAVRAAWHLHAYARVVALVETHRAVFAPRLPIDVLEAYVSSLTELGQLSQALDALREWRPLNGHNLVWLELHVHQARGDSAALATLTDKLLAEHATTQQPLPVRPALSLARVLRRPHPLLAERLWRALARQEIPDDDVSNMVSMAFRLGIPEAELRPWMSRMGELARTGRGGVRQVSLPELLQWQKERDPSLEDVAHAYFRADVPIHTLPRPESLAALAAPPPPPDSRLPLLARHGGQRFDAPLPAATDVRMDVTAALLGSRLDLLDRVERAFDTIWIAPKLISLLHGVVLPETLHHQPKRVEHLRAVLDRVDLGRLRVTEAPDPPDFHQTLHAALAALNLSAVEWERCRAHLNLPAPPFPPTSPARDELHLSGGTVETLEELNLLDRLLDTFQSVVISSRLVAEYRADVREADSRARMATGVERLIERLRLGLERGKYRTLPPYPFRQDDPLQDDLRAVCLADLISQPTDPHVITWADDRWLSRAEVTERKACVSTATMLRLLRQRHQLDDAPFFEHLIQLREANYLFLPPLVEELLFHLGNSPLAHQGALAETRELKVLRRSFNAALSWHRPFLRKITAQPSPRGAEDEGTFLLETRSAAEQALIEVWMMPPGVTHPRAAADWILDNLYLTYDQLLAAVEWPTHLKTPRDLRVSSIVSLLGGGMTLPVEQARKFFAWIDERRLRPWLQADATQAFEVARQLVAAMAVQVAGVETRQRQVAAHGLHRRAMELPDSVLDHVGAELAAHATFAGIGRRGITLHGHSFDWQDCVMAVYETVHQRSATLTDATGRRFEVHPLEAGRTGFWSADFGIARFEWDNPAFAVLLDPPHRQGPAIDALWAACDVPHRHREEVAAAIFAIAEPTQRLDQTLTVWLRTSVDAFFDELAEHIRETGRFQPGELLPTTLSGVRRHLRLDDVQVGGAREKLTTAAQILLDEVGLLATCTRWAALPVPYPDVVLRTFATAPAEEQDLILDALTQRAASPISLPHALRLIHEARRRDPPHLAGRFLEAMHSARWEAFEAIVHWVHASLMYRREILEAPADEALLTTWVCAHRLFCAFRPDAPQQAERLRDLFTDMRDRQVNLQNLVGFERCHDVAHPEQLNAATFAVAALHYGLAGAQLDEAHHEALHRFTHQTFGDRTAWSFELWRDGELATDVLGSFLAGESWAKVVALSGVDVSGEAGFQGARVQLTQALEGLGDADDWVSSWSFTYLVTGRLRLRDGDFKLLKQIAAELPIEQRIDEEPYRGSELLYFVALQARHARDVELQQWARERVVSLASRQEAPLQAPHVEVITQASLGTSMLVVPADADSPLKAWGDLLVEWVGRWRAQAGAVTTLVQTASDQLPPGLSSELASTLVQLRASR